MSAETRSNHLPKELRNSELDRRVEQFGRRADCGYPGANQGEGLGPRKEEPSYASGSAKDWSLDQGASEA